MDADEAREAERRRRLIEERRMRTYLAFAEADALDGAGGRFAALPEQKPSVVGAKAETSYPQQPEGSPWANEPSGTEPALGYSVEDQDAVGEPHEQARSAAAIARSASTGSQDKQSRVRWRRF
jgi:hypothetical protein